jgi:nucleoside-diphosphate-sugar epimerase
MTAQSNAETLITIFGGSGFLGRHVVRALAKQQYRIRVAVRRPDLAGHLQPLGRVGQIHAVQANVRHRPSVAASPVANASTRCRASGPRPWHLRRPRTMPG